MNRFFHDKSIRISLRNEVAAFVFKPMMFSVVRIIRHVRWSKAFDTHMTRNYQHQGLVDMNIWQLCLAKVTKAMAANSNRTLQIDLY